MYGSLRSVASELPKSTAKRQGRGGVCANVNFFFHGSNVFKPPLVVLSRFLAF